MSNNEMISRISAAVSSAVSQTLENHEINAETTQNARSSGGRQTQLPFSNISTGSQEVDVVQRAIVVSSFDSQTLANHEINPETQVRAGRPKTTISRETIEEYRSMGYTVTRIAEVCGLSRSALYKRMKELNILDSNQYSNINNTTLDAAICDIKHNHPNCGEVMVIGHLRAKGINVQRHRIREAIQRVDPEGAHERRCRRIRRRVYSVPCPNFIWHVDGNHKMIRWRFVVHVGIDGYSRLCVFCKCSTNNTSQTAFNSFQDAIRQFGRPLKVRTDKGGENVSIWQYMINNSPAREMAAITGSSVHNQRVERFNGDLNRHCANVIKPELYNLESEGVLDPSNDTDLFCLHYVYIPRINLLLKEFVDAHNHHAISTEHNQSPLQLFLDNQHLLPLHSGTVQEINYGVGNVPTSPTIVEVASTPIPLNDQQYRNLQQEIDPLTHRASRPNLYKQVIAYVGNMLLNN